MKVRWYAAITFDRVEYLLVEDMDTNNARTRASVDAGHYRLRLFRTKAEADAACNTSLLYYGTNHGLQGIGSTYARRLP